MQFKMSKEKVNFFNKAGYILYKGKRIVVIGYYGKEINLYLKALWENHLLIFLCSLLQIIIFPISLLACLISFIPTIHIVAKESDNE